MTSLIAATEHAWPISSMASSNLARPEKAQAGWYVDLDPYVKSFSILILMIVELVLLVWNCRHNPQCCVTINIIVREINAIILPTTIILK